MGRVFAHRDLRKASLGAAALAAFALLANPAKTALAVVLLAQASTPATSTPTDADYADWIRTQRSLVRADLAIWDSVAWHAKDLAGRAKHDLERAGGDEKRVTNAKSAIAAADQQTAMAQRGTAVDTARLAVLDRLAQEATLRAVRLAGPNYLMVSQTIGSVSLHSGASNEPLAGDRVLRTGESIETGPGAFAVLLLLDGSWLTLGPETVLQATSVAGRNGFAALRGHFHRRLSCIANDTFRSCGSLFFTADTALGTLGREYAIDASPDGPALVTALGGDMDLRTAAGTALTVREGEWVLLDPKGPPAAPSYVNRNSIVRWWQDIPGIARR